MKTKIFYVILASFVLFSCQKMDRPQLGDYPQDPPPPPYSILKSFWTFDGHIRDTGQYRAQGTAKNVTFVDGVKGQAARIGDKGYIVIPQVEDSLKTPGNLTIAFWMKGEGPVDGGAQGVFALGNGSEYWGNVEIFLENLNEGDKAFVKIHMWNASATDGRGERWIEVKIPEFLNQWSHFAMSYDSTDSKMKVYANGKVVDERSLDNYGPLKFKDLTGIAIGSFSFQTDPTLANHGVEDWARSFKGALDNLRIYNVALSDAEIKKLFDSRE